MRRKIEINENWFFTKERPNLTAPDFSAMQEITLPHTWNAEDGADGDDYYDRRECWYVRKLERPQGDEIYLADIENLKGGTIIFGISTYRGTYLLPPVLKKFHERYPKVHVEISEMDSIDLENQILEGILDLALIAAPPVRIKHGFEELMRDEIMLVTTKEHPVMKYAHECENDPEELWIDLKDTAPYEYILGPPNTVLGRTARDSLREAGVEPLGLDTYLSAAFAAAVAREGVALAFTYRSCRVMRDGFRYLRIGKEGIFLDLALVWPAGKYRSRAAKALADLLHEMAPELLHR